MILFVAIFAILSISISYHIVVYLYSVRSVKRDKKFLAHNPTTQFPKISILKPLKGIDDDLENNLKSFFELDYPEYELIFGFHTNEDPAVNIVKKLVNDFPHVKSRIIIDEKEIGLNPKINNLYNIYPYASGEIIFISDSNTRIQKDFLRKIIKYFNDESVGLVSAAIRGTSSRNIFALFENLHLNSFTFGIVQAASAVADIQITIGKAILIRRDILIRINGFKTFKDYLAEDHLMGLEVTKLGYKVIISTLTIENINQRWSIQKLINRHRRWTLMRWNIDPFFYILESFTNTTFISIILILIRPEFYLIGIAGMTIKITFDYFTSRLICSSLKFFHFLLIPFKDIIMGLIWFSPFIYNRIIWRDSKLKVTRNSKLKPIN